MSGGDAPAAWPGRCLALGRENEIGLKLVFERWPQGEALATWAPAEAHEGWPGVVRGGLPGTVLDEAMSHAVLAPGLESMTSGLRVRFRSPAPSDSPLAVRAWGVERSGRLVEAEAAITGPGARSLPTGGGGSCASMRCQPPAARLAVHPSPGQPRQRRVAAAI